jgi:hypothetical protein
MTQLRIRSVRTARCESILLCFIVLVMVAGGLSQTLQPNSGAMPAKQPFNGKWWSVANVDERSGFLNGAADCLTWKAHEKGFNETPEQLTDRITTFYKSHPGATSLTVIDVWRKLVKPPPSKDTDVNGETWKNPHWYLNGEWWEQGNEPEQRGFLEGYLLCMRTCVPQPTETYSKSVSYYRDKVWDYLQAHPRTASNKAIADILSTLRDRPNP